MKTALIVLALFLLAGCAVVPVASYDTYDDGPYYSSYYYSTPVFRCYGCYGGYGYHRPWHRDHYKHGRHGPRHDGPRTSGGRPRR